MRLAFLPRETLGLNGAAASIWDCLLI